MSCLSAPPNPGIISDTLSTEQIHFLDLVYARNPQELMCSGISVTTPPVYNRTTCTVTTPGVYTASSLSTFEGMWGINSICPTVFQVGIFTQECVPANTDISNKNTISKGNNFNPISYAQIQKEMGNALFNFFSNHPFDENTFSSSVLQNELMSACVDVPGICELSEAPMCKSCSRQRIGESANLIEYCGCYATPDPQFNSSASPQCDYLCTMAASSKLRDVINGNILQCDQTTCIINNVSINSVNSSTGNISFEQVCNQCLGSNTCKCFLDVSIPNVISNMGLNESNFSVKCPYATCYVTDSNGSNPKNTDCAPYVSKSQVTSPNGTNILTKTYSTISPEVWWVLIFFLVLCIFVIFSFAYWGKSFRQSSFTIWKSPPLKDEVGRFSSKNLP